MRKFTPSPLHPTVKRKPFVFTEIKADIKEFYESVGKRLLDNYAHPGSYHVSLAVILQNMAFDSSGTYKYTFEDDYNRFERLYVLLQAFAWYHGEEEHFIQYILQTVYDIITDVVYIHEE